MVQVPTPDDETGGPVLVPRWEANVDGIGGTQPQALEIIQINQWNDLWLAPRTVTITNPDPIQHSKALVSAFFPTLNVSAVDINNVPVNNAGVVVRRSCLITGNGNVPTQNGAEVVIEATINGGSKLVPHANLTHINDALTANSSAIYTARDRIQVIAWGTAGKLLINGFEIAHGSGALGYTLGYSQERYEE